MWKINWGPGLTYLTHPIMGRSSRWFVWSDDCKQISHLFIARGLTHEIYAKKVVIENHLWTLGSEWLISRYFLTNHLPFKNNAKPLVFVGWNHVYYSRSRFLSFTQGSTSTSYFKGFPPFPSTFPPRLLIQRCQTRR